MKLENTTYKMWHVLQANCVRTGD